MINSEYERFYPFKCSDLISNKLKIGVDLSVPCEEYIQSRIKYNGQIDFMNDLYVMQGKYEDPIFGTFNAYKHLNRPSTIEFPALLEQARKSIADKICNNVIEAYNTRNERTGNMNDFKTFEENTKFAHGRVLEILDHCFGTLPRAIVELDATMLKYIKVEMPSTTFDKKGCSNMKKYNYGYGLPTVSKVETYNNRVVKVTFIDGTFTKSVCSENDIFDIDVGITICMMKRMFGKDGNKIYNNMIRDIHKTMDQNDKKKLEEKTIKAANRDKKQKFDAKKAEKKAAERQEQIEIQKTAMIEALRQHDLETGDDSK